MLHAKPLYNAFLRTASRLALLSMALVYIAPLISSQQLPPLSSVATQHHHPRQHHDSLQPHWCDYCGFWAHLNGDFPSPPLIIHSGFVFVIIARYTHLSSLWHCERQAYFSRAPPAELSN